jgi:hypothetical protein
MESLATMELLSGAGLLLGVLVSLGIFGQYRLRRLLTQLSRRLKRVRLGPFEAEFNPSQPLPPAPDEERNPLPIE